MSTATKSKLIFTCWKWTGVIIFYDKLSVDNHSKKNKKTNINLFFQLQFQKTHRTTVYNYQDVQDK